MMRTSKTGWNRVAFREGKGGRGDGESTGQDPEDVKVCSFAWGPKLADGPKGVALEGGMGEASMSSGLL